MRINKTLALAAAALLAVGVAGIASAAADPALSVTRVNYNAVGADTHLPAQHQRSRARHLRLEGPRLVPERRRRVQQQLHVPDRHHPQGG
jgi:hypothetical protein